MIYVRVEPRPTARRQARLQHGKALISGRVSRVEVVVVANQVVRVGRVSNLRRKPRLALVRVRNAAVALAKVNRRRNAADKRGELTAGRVIHGADAVNVVCLAILAKRGAGRSRERCRVAVLTDIHVTIRLRGVPLRKLFFNAVHDFYGRHEGCKILRNLRDGTHCRGGRVGRSPLRRDSAGRGRQPNQRGERAARIADSRGNASRFRRDNESLPESVIRGRSAARDRDRSIGYRLSRRDVIRTRAARARAETDNGGAACKSRADDNVAHMNCAGRDNRYGNDCARLRRVAREYGARRLKRSLYEPGRLTEASSTGKIDGARSNRHAVYRYAKSAAVALKRGKRNARLRRAAQIRANSGRVVLSEVQRTRQSICAEKAVKVNRGKRRFRSVGAEPRRHSGGIRKRLYGS